jgi:hypothetical protein
MSGYIVLSAQRLPAHDCASCRPSWATSGIVSTRLERVEESDGVSVADIPQHLDPVLVGFQHHCQIRNLYNFVASRFVQHSRNVVAVEVHMQRKNLPLTTYYSSYYSTFAFGPGHLSQQWCRCCGGSFKWGVGGQFLYNT